MESTEQLITTCHRGHPRTPENTLIESDGYKRCRACASVRYALHREVVIARSKVWHKKNVEKGRASCEKWRVKNLEKIALYKKTLYWSSLEVREKARARATVKNAVKAGHFYKFPTCEVCHTGPTQSHHDNYDEPLDVRWLCRPCHQDHHNGM